MSISIPARRTRNLYVPGLEFAVKIIPYVGDDDWVEECIVSAHRCLTSDVIPPHNPACEFCNYCAAAREVE